jgi:hypothetical protein
MTDEMQRLIDAALMIVAVIVEALRSQHCRETAHGTVPCSKTDLLDDRPGSGAANGYVDTVNDA